MARKKSTNQTDTQKIELTETKVSNELKKNAAALLKAMENATKYTEEHVERLEELRFDFTLEEQKMAEAREAHKLAMQTLEDETKENAAEVLADAQTKAEDMVKNAQAEKERIIAEKTARLEQLNTEHELAIVKNERLYKEHVLGNKKEALNDLLDEFELANISTKDLETLYNRVSVAEQDNQEKVAEAVNLTTERLTNQHQMELVQLKSTHAQEVAIYTPRIESLEEQNTQLKTQIEKLHEQIAAMRDAETQRSQALRSDINISTADRK